MSEPAAPPVKRPIVVAFLYAYCVVAILLGLIVLAGGVALMDLANSLDSDDQLATIVSGVVIFGGVALAVIHAVPLFLKRSDTSWRIVLGFLLSYIVIWGCFFAPFLVFPA